MWFLNVKRLRELVKLSDKTIRQIQLEAGLNSGQLYRILSGHTETVIFDTAEKLADVLNVSLDEFRKE